jgi:hypothetical protein
MMLNAFISFAAYLPPFLQLLPASCAPESKEDKDGLEKEPDKTCLVCIETKGRDVVDILVDVAWEDGDIEEGQQSTHHSLGLLFPKEQHAQTKSDFHYS